MYAAIENTMEVFLPPISATKPVGTSKNTVDISLIAKRIPISRNENPISLK
jgi:hypothetical protein